MTQHHEKITVYRNSKTTTYLAIFSWILLIQTVSEFQIPSQTVISNSKPLRYLLLILIFFKHYFAFPLGVQNSGF